MASLVTRFRVHASIPLYRSAYALMISSGAVSVLGVVYWAVATRLFEPEVVGRSSSAIAALTFLAGLASLYLDGSLIRFLPRAGRAAPRIVRSAYLIAVTCSAVVALVFLLGIDVWAPRLGFLASSPSAVL